MGCNFADTKYVLVGNGKVYNKLGMSVDFYCLFGKLKISKILAT